MMESELLYYIFIILKLHLRHACVGIPQVFAAVSEPHVACPDHKPKNAVSVNSYYFHACIIYITVKKRGCFNQHAIRFPQFHVRILTITCNHYLNSQYGHLSIHSKTTPPCNTDYHQCQSSTFTLLCI